MPHSAWVEVERPVSHEEIENLLLKQSQIFQPQLGSLCIPWDLINCDLVWERINALEEAIVPTLGNVKRWDLNLIESNLKLLLCIRGDQSTTLSPAYFHGLLIFLKGLMFISLDNIESRHNLNFEEIRQTISQISDYLISANLFVVSES